MKVPKIIPDDEEPIAVEIMEQAIVDIAAAMKRIERSRLTRQALVVLISHNSKVNQTNINLVLNNLAALERVWLKPQQ